MSEEREEREKGGRVSVLHRIGSWFAIHEDEDEELYEEEPAAARRNVVPLSGREGRRLGAEVAVFMPRSFGDVTEIADALRGGRVVIVNLQGVERPLLQRVVDFTSGVAYTLDGKIQKLADSMYLVVPAGVNVNSQGLRESLIRDGSLDFMTDRG